MRELTNDEMIRVQGGASFLSNFFNWLSNFSFKWPADLVIKWPINPIGWP